MWDMLQRPDKEKDDKKLKAKAKADDDDSERWVTSLCLWQGWCRPIFVKADQLDDESYQSKKRKKLPVPIIDKKIYHSQL